MTLTLPVLKSIHDALFVKAVWLASRSVGIVWNTMLQVHLFISLTKPTSYNYIHFRCYITTSTSNANVWFTIRMAYTQNIQL